MTEVVKNITNPGIRIVLNIEKSTDCEAVDWSTKAHAQNPRGLKSAAINRLVAVVAGELRHQSTRLEFP